MLINLKKAIRKYNMNITGIIHVGAHSGEEYPIYKECGINNVYWIEVNPKLAKIAYKKTKQPVINIAIGNRFKTLNFNFMSLTGSSSLLKPQENLNWRKDLKIVKQKPVQTVPLRIFSFPGCNFLNLDIQGAELMALQGANLEPIDYIYTEVHLVETYKNCPKVKDIDAFLHDYRRVETKWIKERWGDALYLRK